MDCFNASSAVVTNISTFSLFVITFFSAAIGVLTYNLVQMYVVPRLISLFERRGWFSSKPSPFVRTPFPSASFTRDSSKCYSFDGSCTPAPVDPNIPVALTYDQEVEAFEKATDTKLLFLYHNEGGPFSSSSLGTSDANNFVTSLRKIDPQENLTVILNTPGGTVNAAEIIINAFRNHRGRINVYVPFYACSAGTMIALAADKLYLGQNAHLGPFDPVIGTFGMGAKNILSALPDEDIRGSFLSPVYRGLTATCKRAMTRMYANLADRIALEKFSPEQVERIKAQMIDGDIAHDTPFFYSDLSYLGDYVSCTIPENVYAIYDKFLESGTPKNRSSPLMSMLGL